MNRKTILQRTNITNCVNTNSPNSIRITMICLLLLTIFTMIGCDANKCKKGDALACDRVCSDDKACTKACFDDGIAYACSLICYRSNENNLDACTKACHGGFDDHCETVCKQAGDKDACAKAEEYNKQEARDRKLQNDLNALRKQQAEAERIANLPKIVSTEDLGQLGTKAQDGQWLILVGMVDEVKAGSGGNFFVFAPKMNLTQNSREIRCTVKHDGRAKQVKVGDVITISGVNKYNKYHDFIAINDCRFHGYDNQADNALRELTGTNSSN